MQSIRRTRTPPSQKPGLHNTVSAVGAEFVSPGRKAWENSFKQGPRPGGSAHGTFLLHEFCALCFQHQGSTRVYSVRTSTKIVGLRQRDRKKRASTPTRYWRHKQSCPSAYRASGVGLSVRSN